MWTWAKWVMGIKEGNCWDEHWVLHVCDESLNAIPEIVKKTKQTKKEKIKLLYITCILNKNKVKVIHKEQGLQHT